MVNSETSSLEDLKNRASALRATLDKSAASDAISQCVPAIIVLLDEGVIVYSTPLADTMFGYIEGELFGKSLNFLIPERFHTNHDKHFGSYSHLPSSRPMGTTDMNLVAQHKDGSEFPVAIGLHPRMFNGERCAVATILRTKK
jgi:PAS domain S-box-containing protein